MSDVMDQIAAETASKKKTSKRHSGSGSLNPNRKVYIKKEEEIKHISCELASNEFIPKGWRFICKNEAKGKKTNA